MNENITSDGKSEQKTLALSVTFNGEFAKNTACALFGAAIVLGICMMLQWVGSFFGAVMPIVLGIALFAALVGAFFALMKSQKSIRKMAKFKLTLGEAYTAATVFLVMGFLAAACLHAFKGDGMALPLWNQGVATLTLGYFAYGAGKILSSLWKSSAPAPKQS